MEKVIQLFDKKFFKHWFLHTLALWLFMVIEGTGRYVYQSYLQGEYYLKNQDGTPTTAIDFFINNNSRLIPIISLFVIAFLLEFNYKWVAQNIQKSFISVLKNTLFFGLILSIYYAIAIFSSFKSYEFAPDLLVILFAYTFYFFRIDLDNLLYIEADGNYLTFFEKNKKTTVRHTLTDLLHKLPKNAFLKINKSCIISLNKVDKVENQYIIINGSRLFLAKSYRDVLINALR